VISIGQEINSLVKNKSKIPATTLDMLVDKLALKPPFLLKLDVQGAEESVLDGAPSVLRNTHVVICEADIEDFQDINGALVKAGFRLYDLTDLYRLGDGTLGWFYPIYVSNKLEGVCPRAFWDEKENDAVIGAQVARRGEILRSNARDTKSSQIRSSATWPQRGVPVRFGPKI